MDFYQLLIEGCIYTFGNVKLNIASLYYYLSRFIKLDFADPLDLLSQLKWERCWHLDQHGLYFGRVLRVGYFV